MINTANNQDEQARDLADRIAQIISEQRSSSSIDKLQISVDEILSRLETIESTIPKMKETVQAHPSQDRFQIDDAGIEVVNGNADEKACPFEPGGKPCDHCSMCSSRGF